MIRSVSEVCTPEEWSQVHWAMSEAPNPQLPGCHKVAALCCDPKVTLVCIEEQDGARKIENFSTGINKVSILDTQAYPSNRLGYIVHLLYYERPLNSQKVENKSHNQSCHKFEIRNVTCPCITIKVIHYILYFPAETIQGRVALPCIQSPEINFSIHLPVFFYIDCM